MSIQLKSLGIVTVTTAGTPVPLSATKICASKLRLQPRKSTSVENTGNIYIMVNAPTAGGAATPTQDYAILFQEQIEGMEMFEVGSTVYDLSTIYIDADNSGDGVLVGYQIVGSN